MKTLFACAIMACTLSAQTAQPYPQVGQRWFQPLGFVPGTSTAMTTLDSQLAQLHLANTTGSTVTVTITDNSTACGGSVCQLWPAITIAANTVYENNFGGLIATGGVKWSATTASAVVGWMSGNYTQTIIASTRTHRRGSGVLAALHLRKHPAPVPKNEQPPLVQQLVKFP